MVKNEKVKILRYAAKVLKQEIEKVNGIEILPLNPEDISFAAMKKVVPDHLKHFLQCLCGASEHKLLRIVSIAQSIIFMSSDTQKRMPKQVGLGVSLKASLRSREYITLLNKFGENVNDHEVLGIDAYWAEEIIERGDVMQQYQQILFLVNVPKQHLIMQAMVKKMLHNMLSIPLFISTAANESLRSFFFRSVAHAEDILGNGTCKQIFVTPKRFGVS